MAVVSTEGIWFMGEEFKRTIRVLKDGEFKIKYPKQVKDLYGESDAVGYTMDEAVREFNNKLKEYGESIECWNNIISYS